MWPVLVFGKAPSLVTYPSKEEWADFELEGSTFFVSPEFWSPPLEPAIKWHLSGRSWIQK